MNPTTHILISLAGLALFSTGASGQGTLAQGAAGRAAATHQKRSLETFTWRYYRPGNTGIQGDFCDALWVAPDGDPYIGGYVPSFEEGGFARYAVGDDRWINYSNVDHPEMGHPDEQGSIRIADIAPDAGGRLWMGTWHGALTFDPALGAGSLTRWGPANSGLDDARVEDIDRAPDGTMWFVNGGIKRFDPQTGVWTKWPTAQPFVAVQPKSSGGYLVWSSDRPPTQSFTLVFDSTTQQWKTLTPSGAAGEVVGMPGKDCVDDAGNFWALRSTTPGDWASLDFRRPDGTWGAPPEPYPSVTFGIDAFKAYGNGRALLVDGGSNVQRFDGVQWQSLGSWKSGSFSSSVDVDALGNVWVCGVGGAGRYDASSGTWQRYRITNTGNFDSFNRDLTIDAANGHVYTGANAAPGVGGMVRFDGKRWTGWNQLTYGLGYDWPFPNDYCEALAWRPSSGKVVVSPLDWLYGIHEWDGTGFSSLPPLTGAQRMCEDSLGRLWALGEYYNLNVHDGQAWTSLPITGWGERIEPDPTLPGTVWASTGYQVLRTDGVQSFVRDVSDFPELTTQSDFFSGIAPDGNGVVWVGCTVQYGAGGTGGGLLRIDTNTGTYQLLSYEQGWPFPGQYVQPWAVTPDGRLWMQYDSDFLVAKRGLCWFDGTNVGDFPAPPGGEPQWGSLPHAAIGDLEVRPIVGGYELWISCVSRGLAVLTVKY